MMMKTLNDTLELNNTDELLVTKSGSTEVPLDLGKKTVYSLPIRVA
jgi:hypothetical protein